MQRSVHVQASGRTDPVAEALTQENDPNKVYIVAYSNRPRPEPPVQETVFSISITIDHPIDVQGRAPGVLAPQFYDLLTTCKELYKRLESTVQHDRNTFQQVNIRLPELDNQNICHSTLRSVESSWGYALPRLFIVLPACLVWDDSNPSTHQFRLYFLCDNDMALKGARDTPKHVHLASHPGYNILRPQDFLKVDSDYSLRILGMVDNEFSGNGRNIPSLETFKILWTCG
ncbi:MAG: hypothetical protein BYD32DRAFT_466835 [Podila humilis]|nr:MAG: hypothetical protein BYD32DRAFT_466835 [Podila humilis]